MPRSAPSLREVQQLNRSRPITPLAFLVRSPNAAAFPRTFLVHCCGELSMMTLHKLTAGDGYLYLVRQVAALDAEGHGSGGKPGGLGDYYTERGEAPGQWVGRGLAGLGISGQVS